MAKKSKEEYLWTKVFGIKVGDRVRLKYGKTTWLVINISQEHQVIKLLRHTFPRGRYGFSYSKSISKQVPINTEMKKID